MINPYREIYPVSEIGLPLVLEVHILSFSRDYKGATFQHRTTPYKGATLGTEPLLRESPLRENPVRIEGEYYL